MAFERSERRYGADRQPRRGDDPEYRRERIDDDEAYGPIPDNEAKYDRPSDRRHWRGHDYYGDDEYERGRNYGARDHAPYDAPGRGPLQAEHRERFLRSGDQRHGAAGAGDWRSRQQWNDDWSGPYAGRGPKGYRRSDERIQEDICERLTEHPSIDASDIEVTVSAGDVTLTGRVESRAIKHLSEVMAETVSGVQEVHNQLRVSRLTQEEGSYSRSEEYRAEEQAGPRSRER